jgi:hypothetical protein
MCSLYYKIVRHVDFARPTPNIISSKFFLPKAFLYKKCKYVVECRHIGTRQDINGTSQKDLMNLFKLSPNETSPTRYSQGFKNRYNSIFYCQNSLEEPEEKCFTTIHKFIFPEKSVVCC